MDEVTGLPASDNTAVPNAFQGIWSVRRKIIDHRTASVSHFAGKAVLTGTAFEEHGEMRHGDRVFAAARSYRLQCHETFVSILFTSGAAFIELDLNSLQAVRHHCGEDIYSGRFFFRSRDAWAERWRVDGPRKRYVSLAQYRRLSHPG